MLFEFFVWWYGPGWLGAWKESLDWLRRVQRIFSAGVLLRTLFAPWKRIVSLPGRSLDEKFRGLIDNLVSRTIGFFVRIFVLIAAAAAMAATFSAGILLAAAWPFVPLLFLYLLYRSILG